MATAAITSRPDISTHSRDEVGPERNIQPDDGADQVLREEMFGGSTGVRSPGGPSAPLAREPMLAVGLCL